MSTQAHNVRISIAQPDVTIVSVVLTPMTPTKRHPYTLKAKTRYSDDSVCINHYRDRRAAVRCIAWELNA